MTVTEKRAAGRAVTLQCRCVNQDGRHVLEGVATVRPPDTTLWAPAITLGTAAVQHHDSYRLLLDKADDIPPVPCAVAHPCDEARCAAPSRRPRRG